MSLLRRLFIRGASGNEAEVNASNELLVNTGLTGLSTSANQNTTNTKLDSIIENTTIIPFGFDAGGRTRVSQITTLLDGKILGGDDLSLFENVGTGTATYANNKVNLEVTSGQYMIRQSKRFCPYFAGKSQLIELTFDNFQLESGIIKRVGYFSSSATAPHTANFDGIYFESNGDTNEYRLITTRQGTETLNLDVTTLVSGYNFENFTVIAFDFLWLGGAVLRFFLKTSNGFELIHQFDYSGTQTDIFMLSPNKPIRYEIRSTTGTGSLRYICSQVATEGSINEGGKTLSLYNPTSVTTNAVGTIYALKAIRKQVAFRDTAIQILNIAITVNATSDAGILMLFVNPTLSGAMTYTNISKIQESTNVDRTITAGTGRLVCATPLNVAGSTDIIKENFLSFLSQNITDVMDVFVLAYMPTSSSQAVNAVLTVKEY